MHTEVTRRGAQRIFVVTGRSLNRKTDAVTQAQACLQAQVVGLFDDCIEHTPRDSVMALATAVRAAQADLTHCFSGAPNVAGEGTNIVQDGKLLPAALEAKRRGVLFDVGHGGGSFDYTVAEAAIAQGCPPDTIASDVHVFGGNTPGVPYLPWVMSKFLNMGYSLAEVVSMATLAPARVINRIPKHGTLQAGAPADLSIMELVEGPVSFVDTRNNTRQGKVFLKPAGAVVAGVVFGRPYQAPFAVR